MVLVHEAPHAPWALRGELIVALARGVRRPLTTAIGERPPGDDPDDRLAEGAWPGLPAGLQPLPGPVVVIAARYTESPIGPFVELAVAVPARLGLRPGLCDVVLAVSEPAAKVGMRCNWGYPAEVGSVAWQVDADEVVVRWEERGLELRCSAVGRALPFLVPWRAVQRRGDGPVVVPRTATGIARMGWAAVTLSDVALGLGASAHPLHLLSGHHRAVHISGARFVVRPARHPLGLLSSFRAPLRAMEPGLSYRRARPAAARSSTAVEALQ